MRSKGGTPIGLDVARTGRLLQRAFDEALAGVGGSLPAWLILTTVKQADHPTQREIAAAVGLEGATLTHHLHRMERDGIVSRHRSASDRRNQTVRITSKGEQLFQRMLTTVIDFDARLRRGFRAPELVQLADLLARLRANATDARVSEAAGSKPG